MVDRDLAAIRSFAVCMEIVREWQVCSNTQLSSLLGHHPWSIAGLQQYPALQFAWKSSLELALWYLHLFLQLSVMNVIAIPVWILCSALVTLVGSSWWGFISSELLLRFCLLGIMNIKLFHDFGIILLLLYPESSNSFSAPMKTVALLMIPFFFFLGAICCIQCMWWAPQDFTVDRDLSFPWIDFSQQACVRVCVCVALGCCWWRQRWDLRHPSELVQLSPHKVVAKSQNLTWTGWLESFWGCPSLCSRT